MSEEEKKLELLDEEYWEDFFEEMHERQLEQYLEG